MHGNVTGWPATTTRSCGCWENMASAPWEQKKRGKVRSDPFKSLHYFNVITRRGHRKFKIKEWNKSGFTNTCFQCFKSWMKGSAPYAHFHQFHSNLLSNSCWKNPKGRHTNVAHSFTIHDTETRYCTRIRGVSATPGLKHRLRDSRHSSAWFIYEGCHRTDGLGSNTPQQITRSCLPTLL